MIKDITIGQYLPGSTIVHKLDPRVKILAVTLFIITIFFINSFWFYIPMIIYISGVTSVSKTPFKYLFKGLKSLIIIILVSASSSFFVKMREKSIPSKRSSTFPMSKITFSMPIGPPRPAPCLCAPACGASTATMIYRPRRPRGSHEDKIRPSLHARAR